MRRFTATTLLAAGMALLPTAAHAKVVAEWRMDERAKATTMLDSAGSNHGVIHGDVTTAVSRLVSGSAYRFGGTTSYVQAPDDDSLDPGTADITLRATVQTVDGPMPDDSYDLVRKGVTTTAGGFWKMEIKRASDPSVGKLHCVFKGVLGTTRVAVQRSVDVDVVDGRPHTLQCIRTATSVRAVVDSQSRTKAESSGSISNDQAVIVGAKSLSDDVLRGVLDQVEVNVG